MNYLNLNPVFTEDAQCQDCYKCLRECPVKAIKIENGHAAIMSDRCVLCGRCVEVCPVGAKRIRGDAARVRHLLKLKPRVVASVAPSFATEFSSIGTGAFIAALKKLGFYGVSETALGAQEVSAHAAQELETLGGARISSACPTAVELLKKYHPEAAARVTDLLSPVLAHCKLLKREFGDDTGVVFIGPCIAKKKESDMHPELLDVALTFEELKQWWREEGIEPETLQPAPDDAFIPESAHEGALYPIDGGMIAGIKANCSISDGCFMAFSGIENIRDAVEGIENLPPDRKLFLELLACDGGCVNGPQVESRRATALKRVNIIGYANQRDRAVPRPPGVNIHNEYQAEPVEARQYDDKAIEETLATIGKYSADDELNCGGCGYDSCRQFARALLEGNGERSMCVSYMRKLALKKANALIRTMPSGVAIVDENLSIVECNRRFAQLLGEEAMLVYEACPGLEGALLNKVAPFHDLFRQVLETGADIIEKDVRIDHAVLHVSVFSIENHRIVGGIIQDITTPFVRKEQIVNKAKEVIEKNLSTVQQIAYLLGENAAESEVLLSSIIDSFSPDSADSDPRSSS